MTIPTDLDDKTIVFAAVCGLCRWDKKAIKAVVDAIRSGSLSRLEAIALASLIEGKRPDGLRLKMAGQGNHLTPLEGAKAYDRMVAVGEFVARQVNDGCTREAAKFDAAEHFGVSDATVARAIAMYDFYLAEDGEPPSRV